MGEINLPHIFYTKKNSLELEEFLTDNQLISNADLLIDYLDGNEKLFVRNSNGEFKLLNEDSGFVASDYYLKSEIDSKVNNLLSNIDTENSRASNKETELLLNIDNEVNRAETKETELLDNIDKKLDITTFEEYLNFHYGVNNCTSFTNMPIDAETIIMNSTESSPTFSFSSMPPKGRKIYIINTNTTKNHKFTFPSNYKFLVDSDTTTIKKLCLLIAISDGTNVYVGFCYDRRYTALGG